MALNPLVLLTIGYNYGYSNNYGIYYLWGIIYIYILYYITIVYIQKNHGCWGI